MKFEIRRAKKDDLEDIATLINDNLSKHIPTDFDKLSILLENSMSEYFVATKNLQIVGHACLHIVTNIRGGKIGYIEDVVTHQKHRGSYIATMLLDEIAKHARTKSCYKLIAICDHSMEKFYANRNFSLTKRALIQMLTQE